MKKVYTPLYFLVILFVSCSMPKADNTIAMMNRYWEYYRVDNIDSLKTFYTGGVPDTSFWKSLHAVGEKYGDIKNVSLTKTTVGQAFGEGARIELTYEVEYDRKVLDHEFIFKKDENGVFKISKHLLTK
jgi:hypothetical protein